MVMTLRFVVQVVISIVSLGVNRIHFGKCDIAIKPLLKEPTGVTRPFGIQSPDDQTIRDMTTSASRPNVQMYALAISKATRR
jgi:hypothetical protein